MKNLLDFLRIQTVLIMLPFEVSLHLQLILSWKLWKGREVADKWIDFLGTPYLLRPSLNITEGQGSSGERILSPVKGAYCSGVKQSFQPSACTMTYLRILVSLLLRSPFPYFQLEV